MIRTKTKAAIFIFFVAFAAAPATRSAADSKWAVLKVSVLDPSGAPIPGAWIGVTPNGTGIPYQSMPPVQTDALGKLEIGELPPGHYEVFVRASNFKTDIFKNVPLRAAITYEIVSKPKVGIGTVEMDAGTEQYMNDGDNSPRPVLEDEKSEPLKLEISTVSDQEQQESAGEAKFKFTFINSGKQDLAVNLGYVIGTRPIRPIPARIVLTLTNDKGEIRHLQFGYDETPSQIDFEYPITVPAEGSASITENQRDYYCQKPFELWQNLPAGKYSLSAEFAGEDTLVPYDRDYRDYRRPARVHPRHFWVGNVVSSPVQIVLPAHAPAADVK